MANCFLSFVSYIGKVFSLSTKFTVHHLLPYFLTQGHSSSPELLGFLEFEKQQILKVSHLYLVKRHLLFCDLVSFAINCARISSVGWPLVDGYQTYASQHL